MMGTRVEAGLRVPTAADVPALMALERACTHERWSADAWRDELGRADRRWRTAHRDGRLVAVGGLWLAPDAAHVLWLAVAPEHRRGGLGGRILAALVDEAHAAGRSRTTLEVRASNVAARRLYRRHGFVSHGLRPGYYADGEDAAVLWRGAPAVDDGARGGG